MNRNSERKFTPSPAPFISIFSILVIASVCGCRRQDVDEGSAANHATASVKSEPLPVNKQTESPVQSIRSILEIKDRCYLREHGLILDLGSDAAAAYENFSLQRKDPPEPIFYEGQSFRTFEQMSQDFVFWTQKELPATGFEALVRGANSERIAVYIDGERLGAAQLKPDVIRIVRMSRSDRPLTVGQHRLTLGLSRPHGNGPSADIGWVRLGPPSTLDSDQPASRDQVFSEVSIGKDRLAGIVVKPGAIVSCPLWLPDQAQLSVSLGIWGAGMAEGEISVVDQQGVEHIVARTLRNEDEKRGYVATTVDLSRFSSQFVDLQFRAQRHSQGARVVFGAPRLVTQQLDAAASPRAKRAIVVILGALGARHTPPASAQSGLAALSQLAQAGTTFPNYRATSTSVTSLIASLLTGLAPYQHGLSGLRSVLPLQLPTLAGAVETSGGRSAFMTGVPTSSSEFGLDRGFELFSVSRPQADQAATEPLHKAVDWLKTTLETDGPVLAMIHLRGAHPPFDISKERARELPPAEYGGELSPRRAAIQLGAIGHSEAHRRTMNEEDWTRLEAMEKAALERQNHALDEMIQWLRQSDLYDDTLLIVMGDVAAGERPLIPYGEDAPLLDEFLSVPLIIKFPRGHLRASRVKGAFAPRDITRTLAKSLGLDFEPKHSDAIDLGQSSASRFAYSRPHIAFRDDQFSMKLGALLLRGTDQHTPELCFMEADPGCQMSRNADYPALVQSLWLTAFSTLGPALKESEKAPEREPNAELDNALFVWGVTP